MIAFLYKYLAAGPSVNDVCKVMDLLYSTLPISAIGLISTELFYVLVFEDDTTPEYFYHRW